MFYNSVINAGAIQSGRTYYRRGVVEVEVAPTVVRATFLPLPRRATLSRMLRDLRASGLLGSGWSKVLVTEDSSSYYGIREDVQGMYFNKYLSHGVFSKVRSDIWHWWVTAPIHGVSLSVIDGDWYVVLEAARGERTFHMDTPFGRISLGNRDSLEEPVNSGAFRKLRQDRRSILEGLFRAPRPYQEGSPKGHVGHGRKPWDRR